MEESTGDASPSANSRNDGDGEESLASHSRKRWMAKDASAIRQKGGAPPVGRRWSLHNTTSTTEYTSTTPTGTNSSDIVQPSGKYTDVRSRWETRASDASLKAPMSWHGGKSKLSPSKLRGVLYPTLTTKKPSTIPSLTTDAKDEGGTPTTAATTNILRGSKVYKIGEASKTSELNNFLPKAKSSSASENNSTSRAWTNRSSSVEEDTEKEEEVSKLEESFTGLSMEALPPSNDRFNNSTADVDLLSPITEGSHSRRDKKKLPRVYKPFENPFDGEDYEDDDDDVSVGLNDELDDLDDDDDFEEEELKNADESPGVKQFIVDRVPKKKWQSENLENCPIWPPVVKVRSYERKEWSGYVSGISIGSGFTDDDDWLTDDFTDDGAFSLYSIAASISRMPADSRTSYRISYHGRTTLDLEGYNNKEERFQPVGGTPDGAPNLPSRPSRVADSVPQTPQRRPAPDDMSFDEALSIDCSTGMETTRSRPDVWITALSGENSQELMWNVKRVWDLESEDEKEQEHSVHTTGLFSKIKTLVGAPDSDDSDVESNYDDTTTITEDQKDGMPQLPRRAWQMQKVVERRGKLQEVEAKLELNTKQFDEQVVGMATQAVLELQQNAKASKDLINRTESKLSMKRRASLLASKKAEQDNERKDHQGTEPVRSEQVEDQELEQNESTEDALPVTPTNVRKTKKQKSKKSERSKKSKKKSKRKSERPSKERKMITAADMYKSASSSSSSSSESESDSDDDQYASNKKTAQTPKQNRILATPKNARRVSANMISAAAMVQSDSSDADSDSSESATKTPSQQRRGSRHSNESKSPWWKKEGVAGQRTPKRVTGSIARDAAGKRMSLK